VFIVTALYVYLAPFARFVYYHLFPRIKECHVTLNAPLYGYSITSKVEQAMINLHTKFEMPISALKTRAQKFKEGHVTMT